MASLRPLVVAEVTIAVDAAGTQQLFMFATSGFSTKSTDTPASTPVLARLINPGSVQWELFAGARVAGVVRPSFGRLVLNNSDGLFDDWLDYGTSNGLVTVRYGVEGAAYPSAFTTVYVARILGSPICDFNTMQLALQDRSYLLDNPFATSTFTGAGGREGEGVSGMRKQLILGQPGFTPVKIIDASRGIVYVQANAADERVHGSAGIDAYELYDAGVALTHQSSKSTWASFVADAPIAGYFTTYLGDAETGLTTGKSVGPVFMRYGSAPTGELRVMSTGYLLNYSTDVLRAWKYSDLLSRAGITTPLATGSVDFPLGNRLIDGDVTFAQVANDCAKAYQIAWGFNKDDEPFSVSLTDPSDTIDAGDTVKFVFSVHNCKTITRIPVPDMGAPVWQVVCNAGAVWPCAVSSAARSDIRAEMSRQWPYASFSASAQAVRTANPGASTETVALQGRYFTTRTEQRAFGERYLSLYGGRRDLFRLVCSQFDATILGLELHDKVQLSIARFNCSPARTFRIIGIAHDLKNSQTTFTIWGGSKGPGLDSGGLSDGTVTVGDGPLTPTEPTMPPGGSAASTPPVVTGASGESGDGSGLLPAITHHFVGSVGGSGGFSSGIVGNGSNELPACTHVFTGNASADFYISDVVVLVRGFPGADGSTSFVDDSGYGHTCTAAGNAEVSTDIATFPNGQSVHLDGTGDHVVVANNTDAFHLAAGAFCCDFFFYLSASGTAMILTRMANISLASHEYAFFVDTSYAYFYYGTRTSTQKTIRFKWTSAISTGTLYHGHIQRNANGDFGAAVGGVPTTQYAVDTGGGYGADATGTPNDTTSLGSITHDLWIGEHFAGDGLNGYVQVRLTKAERYTLGASYTPPALFPAV